MEGEEHLRCYQDKDTKSGFPLERYFCINCGSNVFLQSYQQAIRIIALGSLDSPTDWGTSLCPLFNTNIQLQCIPLVPKTELWSEHRQHWINGIKLQKKIVKL